MWKTLCKGTKENWATIDRKDKRSQCPWGVRCAGHCLRQLWVIREPPYIKWRKAQLWNQCSLPTLSSVGDYPINAKHQFSSCALNQNLLLPTQKNISLSVFILIHPFQQSRKNTKRYHFLAVWACLLAFYKSYKFDLAVKWILGLFLDEYSSKNIHSYSYTIINDQCRLDIGYS